MSRKKSHDPNGTLQAHGVPLKDTRIYTGLPELIFKP
jgi:hypothetical protein